MRCEICLCDPCETPGFCERCREVDARNASQPEPNYAPSDQAPQVTWDATQYALRTNGLKALAYEYRRLHDLSDRQLRDLIASLQKHGVEEGLLQALMELIDA